MPQDGRRGAKRLQQRGKLNRQHRFVRREGHELELGLKHHPERALGAHHQLRQVERLARIGKLVQVVAADSPEHFRKTPIDLARQLP